MPLILRLLDRLDQFHIVVVGAADALVDGRSSSVSNSTSASREVLRLTRASRLPPGRRQFLRISARQFP